jgi:hypothetical protein
VLKKPVGTDISFDVLYLGNYHVACWQLAYSSLLTVLFIASRPKVIHSSTTPLDTLGYTGRYSIVRAVITDGC